MSEESRTPWAPFSWFGGKRRIASEIWKRLGGVRSYNEPFFGSGAVLLGRPRPFVGVETVNDLDGLLCNFWRAVRSDPSGVSLYSDWPSSECDLFARHTELVDRRSEITRNLTSDPRWFDPELAGWWLYAQSTAAIKRGLYEDDPTKIINIGHHQGIHALRRDGELGALIKALSERLANVRILCGDWERAVQSETAITAHMGGVSAVFFDPPYTDAETGYAGSDAIDEVGVAKLVAERAREIGARSDVRVVLCGFVGEHVMPGWGEFRWAGRKSFGKGVGDEAAVRRRNECIWFSPACVKPEIDVFDMFSGENG